MLFELLKVEILKLLLLKLITFFCRLSEAAFIRLLMNVLRPFDEWFHGFLHECLLRFLVENFQVPNWDFQVVPFETIQSFLKSRFPWFLFSENYNLFLLSIKNALAFKIFHENFKIFRGGNFLFSFFPLNWKLPSRSHMSIPRSISFSLFSACTQACIEQHVIQSRSC